MRYIVLHWDMTLENAINPVATSFSTFNVVIDSAKDVRRVWLQAYQFYDATAGASNGAMCVDIKPIEIQAMTNAAPFRHNLSLPSAAGSNNHQYSPPRFLGEIGRTTQIRDLTVTFREPDGSTPTITQCTLWLRAE